MRRYFNTTGPCTPEEHYMLPPEDRLIGVQLHRYIHDNLYWVLYGPPKTGKTTFLLNWMDKLDDVVVYYISLKPLEGIDNREKVLSILKEMVLEYAMPLGISERYEFTSILDDISKAIKPKKLVILFDDVEVLGDLATLTFLSHIRSNFCSSDNRPSSMVFVSTHRVKTPTPDYPFNIVVDFNRMPYFSMEEVEELFAQHTAETGQQITREALDYVWEQSKGQPWIVNSLFKRATMRVLDPESTETVALEHVELARKQMVDARETHLDSLGKRLHDPEVRHVIECILTGDADYPLGREDHDVQLTTDLGLIYFDPNVGFVIANPVYEEILLRSLNSRYHDSTPPPNTWRWQKPDGRLDMDALLKAFQKFWRRHSAIWEEKTDYTEAFPHLLLMAFLQRLTNGNGDIHREAASGRGRMDLLVTFMDEQFIVEIKILHYYETPKSVLSEGLEQVRDYRNSIDTAVPAYLVIFDRRAEAKSLDWDEKLTWTQEGDVTVVGC